MEVPIRIIITFFVAVTVAALIISISRNILKSSERDINEISSNNKPPSDEEKIIDLGYFDDEQIAGLAIECYKMNYGKALNNVLCFSVHDESGAGGTNPENVENIIRSSKELKSNVNVIRDNYAGTDYALRIYYEPASDTLEIRK